MTTQNDQKLELLANCEQFARTEIKPQTKKQLGQRLVTILKEIDALKLKPAL